QSVRVSKLLLATRTTSPLRVEGRIDLLEILDVISNRLLLVANFIQAPVYALGQAAKLLFCKPPFFASKLHWMGVIAPVPRIMRLFWAFSLSNPPESPSQEESSLANMPDTL